VLNYQNKHLRSVTLFRDQPTPFVVVMAQTTTSRERLLQRLFVFSLAPQQRRYLGNHQQLELQ